MKVIQNCRLTGGCPNDYANSRGFIETDDFYWGIAWARNNNVDILSMSFLGSYWYFGPTIYNALYDAYHQDDILLLSVAGNPSQPQSWNYPKALDVVMGVGGLYSDGSSYGHSDYKEISALSGGGTLDFQCLTGSSFCEPNGDIFNYAPFGGTSSSTAITAGIAGLVRAYNPSLSASQVRQRLINTSTGPHNTVNAVRAVLNDVPLTVSIIGPSYIDNSGSYTWEAIPEGGNIGYSYVWEYREDGFSNPWQTVGTNKTYTRFVDRRSQMYQFTLRVTVTSGSEQNFATIFVTVTQEDCPPNQICPQ